MFEWQVGLDVKAHFLILDASVHPVNRIPGVRQLLRVASWEKSVNGVGGGFDMPSSFLSLEMETLLYDGKMLSLNVKIAR